MKVCFNYSGMIIMFSVLFATSLCCMAQTEEKRGKKTERPTIIKIVDDDAATIKNIETILAEQGKCWNSQDIGGFMETYWKSEQLTFCSRGQTRRGWQATLDAYKRSYPPEKMGKLSFDNLETTLLSKGNAFVIGQWHLDDKGLKSGGNFTLILKTFDEQWKIIHDHTSTLEEEIEPESDDDK